MAPKNAEKNKTEGPQEIEIKIAPEVTENTPSYYCNFVSVGHSKYDFTLTILRLPTTLKPDQVELAKKGKRVPVEAAFEIIISPQLISGLIDALSVQKRKYEEQFGKIQEEKKP